MNGAAVVFYDNLPNNDPISPGGDGEGVKIPSVFISNVGYYAHIVVSHLHQIYLIYLDIRFGCAVLCSGSWFVY